MLGEQILESQGKATGRRVIDTPDGPRLETTVEADATALGIAGHITGTFVAHPRAGGVLAAVGRGLFIGAKGETAAFEAHAIGTPGADGSVSMRGSLVFHTQDERLARLGQALIVFEEEVAPDGTTSKKAWEWR